MCFGAILAIIIPVVLGMPRGERRPSSARRAPAPATSCVAPRAGPLAGGTCLPIAQVVPAPSSSPLTPIVISLDPAVRASAREARYALRTIAHTAGFPVHFAWHDDLRPAPEVYYGPRLDVAAAIVVPSVPWPLAEAPTHHPVASRESGGVPHLVFAQERQERDWTASSGDGDAVLRHPTDVVFAAFWLLTGAAEPSYPRSRFDDLDLDASVLTRDGLLARPVVSLLAARWRAHLERRGLRPEPWPWEDRGGCAFALSSDVDYPEIIRPIEVLRVLRARGVGGLRLAARVASGASHFWTFREWFPLARRLGTRPCFYFMARQGSLVQYALGTPDDFYDVRTPRFQQLFAELRDEGCEIGLHASFHAHRGVDVLRREVQRIAEAAQVACAGNRHHYWHLDPADPNETLRRHAEAGLRYDSSLGLEYYPGFRRGICHPFRVFDRTTGVPLRIVQLPPAWMDDHFDRRLARNGIRDAEAAARALVEVARDTRGIVVVDYHSRGMNADFYPRYGPWLERFAAQHLEGRVRGMTPLEIHDAFVARDARLLAASRDETVDALPPRVSAPPAHAP